MVLLSQLKHQAEVPGATLYNIRRDAANCHHIHTHALANYYPLNTWRTLLLRASDLPPDPLTNLRTTPDLAVHLPLVQLTPIVTINKIPFPTPSSAEVHRPFQVKNVKTRLLPLLPPPKAPLIRASQCQSSLRRFPSARVCWQCGARSCLFLSPRTVILRLGLGGRRGLRQNTQTARDGPCHTSRPHGLVQGRNETAKSHSSNTSHCGVYSKASHLYNEIAIPDITTPNPSEVAIAKLISQ